MSEVQCEIAKSMFEKKGKRKRNLATYPIGGNDQNVIVRVQLDGMADKRSVDNSEIRVLHKVIA